MAFEIPGLTNGQGALASKANAKNAQSHDDTVHSSSDDHSSSDIEKRERDSASNDHSGEASDNDSLNKVDQTAQRGVQSAQAMTQVWSKRDLIIGYVSMWIVQFILAFASGVVGTLTPYVTSSFQEHSLTALTSVVSGLISGLFKLPYVKIMDIWGRPQALCLMIASYTLGLIMMAGCNNVATYCAAQVFFWVGSNGISFSITVFIADTSKLKNRGLMLGFISSPYLITTWIYGFAANDIINRIGFRWGFGIFVIVVPIVCAPWALLMFWHERKAKKLGLIGPRQSRGNLRQSAAFYAVEFDVVGLLLLATGLALFLLAFNIYTYQVNQWRSPLIICFIIFGALIIAAFAVWEAKFASVPFVPWNLLKNRTVQGTYVMALALYVGWYVWNSYFFSLLIVLYGQTIVHATYISNIYTMGSCTISIIYGLALRYYGKLKMYSLFWGVPLTTLGVALMIAFRQPDVNIGLIVMCQIFIAFGGGVLVISEQTTLMAVSKQQDFPALLAVESAIIYVGGSIGATIAGAIWTGVFPQKLAEYLPADAMGDFTSIYGDLVTQSSYPIGSPTRDAINRSYSETQRLMLIAATCIYVTMLFSVLTWQNVDVKKMKQRTVGLL